MTISNQDRRKGERSNPTLLWGRTTQRVSPWPFFSMCHSCRQQRQDGLTDLSPMQNRLDSTLPEVTRWAWPVLRSEDTTKRSEISTMPISTSAMVQQKQVQTTWASRRGGYLSRLPVTSRPHTEEFFHSKEKHGPLTSALWVVLDKHKRLDLPLRCCQAQCCSLPCAGITSTTCTLARLPRALPILVNHNRSQGAARALNIVPGWPTHSTSWASPESTQPAPCSVPGPLGWSPRVFVTALYCLQIAAEQH